MISAAALAVIALSLDKPGAGVLAALTAGGALGFLRHGFPPASSFMGDTGSNLLGYLLGAIAVQGALKTNAVVALILPLIVLAVPILDTGFVIAKRIKYRQPIYRADRWHFHHRMANIGFSQRRTLAYLYGWALVMAGLALALRFVPYSDDHGNFDPLWTAVMIACADRRARRERLPGDHARDPEAAHDARCASSFGRRRHRRPRRRPSTRASRASWRPAASPRRPETGEFEAVDPEPQRGPRSGCHKLVTSAPPRPALFGYSRRPPGSTDAATGGCSSSFPGRSFLAFPATAIAWPLLQLLR